MNLMRAKVNTIIPFLLALVMLVPTTVVATVLVEMSREEMIDGAEVIISAVVQAVHCEWEYDTAAGREQIFTYVELSGIVTYKGVFSGSTIRIRGGTIYSGTGEYATQTAPGMPKFNPGEHVVLFLVDDPVNSPFCPIMNLEKGKMTYSPELIESILDYLGA